MNGTSPHFSVPSDTHCILKVRVCAELHNDNDTKLGRHRPVVVVTNQRAGSHKSRFGVALVALQGVHVVGALQGAASDLTNACNPI